MATNVGGLGYYSGNGVIVITLANSTGNDTIVTTSTPTLVSYVKGYSYIFVAGGTNTGAATLNIDGLGAKAVQCRGGVLSAGDITAGNMATVVYDGTQFQLISPGATTTVAGVSNFADMVLQRPELKDYSETKTAPASSSNVLTLDMSLGNVFTTTLTENVTTLTISNPPASGKAGSFTWVMTQDASARTVSWPASVTWGNGTAPTITAPDAVYVFTFLTVDAGTTWYGFLAGSEMA